MPPDIEKYRTLIASFGLARNQEDELLISLWTVMQIFVDHAFQEEESPENRDISRLCAGSESADLVKYPLKSDTKKQGKERVDS